MTLSAEQNQAFEWGVQYTLTNGRTIVEPRDSRSGAWCATGDGERARLVYRELTATDWTGDPTAEGNQFGVRRTWDNGHTEIEVAPSRHRADMEVRLNNGSSRRASTATVVSRQVAFGPWLFADTRVGH